MTSHSFYLRADETQKLEQAIQRTGIPKSELLHKIVMEWIDRTEVLKDATYIGGGVSIQPKTEWICLRNLPRLPNLDQQAARCQTCKAKNFEQWRACQELKQQ